MSINVDDYIMQLVDDEIAQMDEEQAVDEVLDEVLSEMDTLAVHNFIDLTDDSSSDEAEKELSIDEIMERVELQETEEEKKKETTKAKKVYNSPVDKSLSWLKMLRKEFKKATPLQKQFIKHQMQQAIDNWN